MAAKKRADSGKRAKKSSPPAGKRTRGPKAPRAGEPVPPAVEAEVQDAPPDGGAAPAEAEEEPTRRRAGRARFPIVGIGASAGGLEALQEFFGHMPSDSGMGFVVVTHHTPGT